MTRFFFDVVHSTSSAYDFHGRYFKTVAQAREMAEIVSFDLACSEQSDGIPKSGSATPAGENCFRFPFRQRKRPLPSAVVGPRLCGPVLAVCSSSYGPGKNTGIRPVIQYTNSPIHSCKAASASPKRLFREPGSAQRASRPAT